MGNSKPRTTVAKPYDGFPLFPHANGLWAKKVHKKLHYFGSQLQDPTGEKAFALWEYQRDALMRKEQPPVPSDGGVELHVIVNTFLQVKRNAMNSRELAPRTYKRYDETCKYLIGAWGRRKDVTKLTPADFRNLRATMAEKWQLVALANEIGVVRSLFKFAFEEGLIEQPAKFGTSFKKPSLQALRTEREAKGEQMFTAAQLRAILAQPKLRPAMKAMLLLGLQGGLSNTDLGLLTEKSFDLDGGWLNYARTKNGTKRRIPLWAETVEAVKEAIAKRTPHNDPADADLLFIGARGVSYVGDRKGDRCGKEFKRHCEAAGCPDRTFYDLRRTLETVGEECGDIVAVMAIMGHRDSSMSARYRQKISDDRLRAVVNEVHRWLYADASTDPKAEAAPA